MPLNHFFFLFATTYVNAQLSGSLQHIYTVFNEHLEAISARLEDKQHSN